MVMTIRDENLIRVQEARAQAAVVLRRLVEANAACEAALADEKRSDVFKVVSGRSSLESAIAEARRVIETLDRQIEQASRELDAEDQDVFATDGLEAVVTAGRLAVKGPRFGQQARAAV